MRSTYWIPSSRSISLLNFHLFICIDIYSPISTCRKSKRRNKSSNNRRKCNSEKQSHKFWVNSPVYNLKASRAEVISQRKEIRLRLKLHMYII